MVQENVIEFKGTGKGLYVYIKPGLDFDLIKDQLISKLEATNSFFKGAKILDILCDTMTQNEKVELEALMSTRYQMIIHKEEDVAHSTLKVFNGIYEGKTKFHHGTLRSGQRINYPGNLVVLGDVNPGAEVIAQGNIIIMGSLRGIAHAGSNGNKEACVAAFYLAPTQLRIADIIARSPDGYYDKPSVPEMARIINNAVFIEPYLGRK
ncbi:septum site-determining protein MinC [Alkaliphilus serpentinus]|uniref:Probable septum site-determining protein MinC n=1 Tax=Alkaliphilus serpentinus TaxID=1482731 RepID=A0A833HQ02_9FIRM|nr:septum site-determining protein MinC [Alkaliphilus serpentinus]KAB3531439.1 septum site-determining protein MinC [Alkaliphilus serpentinus]